MSSLFKPPKVKVPKADTPTPTPTIDDAVKDRTESNRLRKRKGASSNNFTGPLGQIVSQQFTPPKQLTGQ